MNDSRSIESCRMVSVWPTSPKITSWWATSPAAGPSGSAASPFPEACAHQRGGPGGGPARRVDLAVVVELDDLGLRHVPRRLGGELHHQHRADREVRRDEDVGAAQRRRARPGRTRWSRSPRARRRRPLRARWRPRWSGTREVDQHVGLLEHAPERRVQRGVGAPGELQVRGAPRRRAQTVCPIRPAAPATATRIAGAHSDCHERRPDGGQRLLEALLVRADARRPTGARAPTARRPARRGHRG